MKLVKARVQNFRSVEDSGEFTLDDLTCMVGKNEAGKTALLTALYGLRPQGGTGFAFDVTRDYPRRFVTRYQERHPSGDAEVVRTWWQLSAAEKATLVAEFGSDAVITDQIQIARAYNQKDATYVLPIDVQLALRHILRSVAQTPGQADTFDGKTEEEILEAVRAAPSELHAAVYKRLSAYPKHSILRRAFELIVPMVPSFFYTSHYDRMSGQVSVNKLTADKRRNTVSNEDKIFLDFLQLSGTSLEQLTQSDIFESLKAQLEAASNDVTSQIFTYWSQNEALEVQLDLTPAKPADPAPFNEGTVVRARVWNSVHRASVPFSERSAGFVWFFSFLVQFAAMRGDAGKVVILLDEPGLTLHGKAQADLLTFIETELLKHHQVIFSTHSPFMVPATRLASVRIVEDLTNRTQGGRPIVLGTRVSEDLLAAGRDTLFPLKGALAYDVVKSLFADENTLLVESPSDILILQSLSDALSRAGREALDGRWILRPSGSIDQMYSFIALFGEPEANIAVLAGGGEDDTNPVEAAKRESVLGAQRAYSAADFTGKEGADIEDILGDELYLEIVNGAFRLSGAKALSLAAIQRARPSTARIVRQVEAAFQADASLPRFDRFAPAGWLIRNPKVLDRKSAAVRDALDRAEKVFAAYNRL